ncbi:uncharacterized protein A1O9_08287 [Exophiala aquamarina CBS 119918]|uniref:Uncharacterized protein n=1 Tax=Exophiala aquamarina CBS 119918 TaxID=1182545 RepID=A0A072P734_9EURO|nr:uncharacterized protein A1O9_08287 [Exophiala aquamarina CBS 119918]KEF55537.1 hypothetical protein A1O9_08287 [Exophiala aquamarina CBS 119918]
MGAQLGINAFGDSVNGFQPGSFTKRLAAWSPMKALTDDEYEKILQQKLLKVEVEISLVDDQIAELQRLSAQQKERLASSTNTAV